MSDLLASTRRKMLIVAGLGVTSMLASCRSTPPSAPQPGNIEDQTAAFLPLVNALRARNGKSALVMDGPATKAAMFQANRMAQNEKMSHLIGFGDSFGSRMLASDVQLPAAENIAMRQQSVEAAFQAWVNSPHHLENMLGPYHGLGVAVARLPARGNVPYWAMVLSGAPHPAAPARTGVLGITIG
ncbi:CAP domain-containing protein [Allorhizobium undicola]|uniref:CAP domain-containing protein n=1 Tax=Allorhizobium undicola TaxID=78527 RepID=UPI003D34CBA2